MHWAREKSTDQIDCVARHLLEAGTIDDDGLLHTGKLAWRALAMLQLELEQHFADADVKKSYRASFKDAFKAWCVSELDA